MPNYEERLTKAFDRRGLRPNTQLAYRKIIRRLRDFHERPLEELDAEDIMLFLDHLRTELGLSPSSLKVYHAALTFYYRYAVGQPELLYPVLRHKIHRKPPQILSLEEVETLLDAITSPVVRAVCMVMYGAGLRVFEACNLTFDDIDRKRGVIRVRNGKGGHGRYSILSPRLLSELRTYYRIRVPPGPLLFPSPRDPSRPITREGVNQGIRKALASTPIRKTVTAHTLRHCFATHLIESGTDLCRVQQLLGHRSVRSTALYINLALGPMGRVQSPLDIPRKRRR